MDVRDFDLPELRRQFGIVLQDPYLFTGTIADNIRLGTEGISDQAIEQAASEVNLRDYIDRLPQAFGNSRKGTRRRFLHRAEATHELRASSRA